MRVYSNNRAALSNHNHDRVLERDFEAHLDWVRGEGGWRFQEAEGRAEGGGEAEETDAEADAEETDAEEPDAEEEVGVVAVPQQLAAVETAHAVQLVEA